MAARTSQGRDRQNHLWVRSVVAETCGAAVSDARRAKTDAIGCSPPALPEWQSSPGALFAFRGSGDHSNLPKVANKQRRLPIAMRALDIQELTRPVQTVLCPVRHAIITVGNCRQCRDFRRIEQSPVQGPFVVCSARDTPTHAASALAVRELVQLPSICASAHDSLAVLLPHAQSLRPWEAVVILDQQAKPVGIVTSSELRRFRAAQVDLSQRLQRLMSTSFATVFPCMSVVDAARLRAEHSFRGLVVVSEDDAFVGVVWEPALERAGSSTLDDTAQPM